MEVHVAINLSDGEIIGVFSTDEKAKDFCQRFDEKWNDGSPQGFIIGAFDLDGEDALEDDDEADEVSE